MSSVNMGYISCKDLYLSMSSVNMGYISCKDLYLSMSLVNMGYISCRDLYLSMSSVNMGYISRKDLYFFLFIFFYANHPLQGFRSHCSVRGYYSLLVATAGAEATTRTGRQHTHAHSTPNSTLYYLQT